MDSDKATELISDVTADQDVDKGATKQVDDKDGESSKTDTPTSGDTAAD